MKQPEAFQKREIFVKNYKSLPKKLEDLEEHYLWRTRDYFQEVFPECTYLHHQIHPRRIWIIFGNWLLLTCAK